MTFRKIESWVPNVNNGLVESSQFSDLRLKIEIIIRNHQKIAILDGRILEKPPLVWKFIVKKGKLETQNKDVIGL